MTATMHPVAGVDGLFEFRGLEQGTDEWHDARRGILTASVVGQIITPSTKRPADNMSSRSLAALLASERITGWTDERYYSDDMERGHLDEPEAINAYTAHRETAVTVAGFLIRDFDGVSIGYSPDGLVGSDGVIEVKSRIPKVHLQTILADEVPAANIAQCQTALLVSGRAWCDYVSYCGGMRLWVKRVEPDPEWQAALVEAARTFEQTVEQMVTSYHERTLGLPMTERTTYEGIIL